MSLQMMRSTQSSRPATVGRRSTVTVQARKTLGQKAVTVESQRREEVEACKFAKFTGVPDLLFRTCCSPSHMLTTLTLLPHHFRPADPARLGWPL
jgi:hypothetical protein